MQSVGAFVFKKLHPKVMILIGAIIMLSSIYISSIVKSWWMFFFIFGISFPFGMGFVLWTPIICAWEWFPDNKGLVSGSIMAAFGFGSFVFGIISTAIVNPDDLKPIVDPHNPYA